MAVAVAITLAFWPAGPAVRVVEEGPFEGPSWVVQLQPRAAVITQQRLMTAPPGGALSPSGRELAVPSPGGIEIWSVDRDAVVGRVPLPRDVVAGGFVLRDIEWSPTADEISYRVTRSETEPDSEVDLRVYAYSFRSGRTRLWLSHKGLGGAMGPMSPDGRQIVLWLYADDGGSTVVAIEGAPQPYEMPARPGLGCFPLWSPNSQTVTMSARDRSGWNWVVWEFGPRSGEARVVYPGDLRLRAYGANENELIALSGDTGPVGPTSCSLVKLDVRTGQLVEIRPTWKEMLSSSWPAVRDDVIATWGSADRIDRERLYLIDKRTLGTRGYTLADPSLANRILRLEILGPAHATLPTAGTGPSTPEGGPGVTFWRSFPVPGSCPSR